VSAAPFVLKPLDFQKWIEEHRHLLKPRSATLSFGRTRISSSPSSAAEPAHRLPRRSLREFFYQVKGNAFLDVMENGKPGRFELRKARFSLCRRTCVILRSGQKPEASAW